MLMLHEQVEVQKVQKELDTPNEVIERNEIRTMIRILGTLATS